MRTLISSPPPALHTRKEATRTPDLRADLHFRARNSPGPSIAYKRLVPFGQEANWARSRVGAVL